MSGMNCADCRNAMTESARGTWLPDSMRRPAERHLETCSGCTSWREDQDRLTRSLRAISVETDRVAVGGHVEAALEAEFERILGLARPMPARAALWPVFWTRAAWAGALAVAIALGWVVTRPSQPIVVARNQPLPTPVRTAPARVEGPVRSASLSPGIVRAKRAQPRPVQTSGVQADEPEQPFVEVPLTLPFAPGERADVVRTDVPVSALIAAGFKMQYSDPGASALADVVVGSDGRARAVRILSISDSSPKRRFQ